MRSHMTNEKEIDLQKLTHRDLLILLHRDVSELKVDMKGVKQKTTDTDLKVNTIETKNKMWGGLMGFGAGLVTILFEKFITR